MKLITMTALAERLGLNKSNVSRSASSGILQGAKKGQKIDLDHPDAQRYIKKYENMKTKRGKPAKIVAKPKTDGEHKTDIDLSEIPADVRKLADKSLKELLRIFGTNLGMDVWLKAAKGLEDLHEKKLKNQVTEGSLISRDFVDKYVFGFLDSIFNRLLQDSPRTIAAEVVELVEAGESLEEIQLRVLNNISQQIKHCKTKIKKVLKNA